MRKYIGWLALVLGMAAIITPLALGTQPVMVAAFISPLLMIGIPIVLSIMLANKIRPGWRLIFIGAVSFITSQVFHLPFNILVLNPLIAALGWQADPGSAGLAIISISAGLSAGVFENITRYLFLRTWAKEARDWGRGMLFGAGHGGCEAVILGGLSLAAFFRVLALRGVDLAAVIPADQVAAAQAQLDAYWNTPWHFFLLAPYERAWAICLHLSASLLVVRSLARRNIAWLGAAILLHAFLDSSAVFINATWGPIAAEAGLTLIGLGCIAIIFHLRSEVPPTAVPVVPADGSAAAPSPGSGVKPAEDLTPEQIEQSRFG